RDTAGAAGRRAAPAAGAGRGGGVLRGLREPGQHRQARRRPVRGRRGAAGRRGAGRRGDRQRDRRRGPGPRFRPARAGRPGRGAGRPAAGGHRPGRRHLGARRDPGRPETRPLARRSAAFPARRAAAIVVPMTAGTDPRTGPDQAPGGAAAGPTDGVAGPTDGAAGPATGPTTGATAGPTAGATAGATAAATAAVRPPAHPGRTAAILGAAWFFLASITPSLIPRGWHLQGVASGLSAAYGYGLGLVVAWGWRKVRDALGIRVTMAPGPARWLRRIGWTVVAVVVALVWLRSLDWQRDTARFVGKSPPGPLTLLLGLAATVLVFVLVILAARGLRALTRRGSRLGQRFLHPWVATALAALLVTTVVLTLSDSLVYRKAMGYAAAKAAVVNGVTPAGRTAPSS